MATPDNVPDAAADPVRPTADPVRTVLDAGEISRALTRITHEILERNHGSAEVVLLGIPKRGVPLARRIARRMGEVEGREIRSGALDVTMYRDDLRLKPARALEHTETPDDVDDKIVVLVDDVLMSGRTIRAALDALGELGRPRAVQLAVLIDRGHRELPIRADFVGKNLPTALTEKVRVRLGESDDTEDAVAIVGPATGGAA
ncbi:MAG: bifunctional pyr operon transcriptional regulator/uracil phosphoribosyltransferase PyrR [Aeromicrobium sp.]|uniref:bifunctional pyr operon transcriptional regulator/uracil phosphoribosyltransferase PyrR n=1 Tax=Aeromicrobium sp. TaxID=1871063 RepID=UPI0025BB1C06|nr:bifunctional pyr operon transcriptional regulator/uracil phosphoribosyltransferase PyrR [Aeromicrobium sp.]MCK5892228.1 bifunctional pyr operon transcriptional regulator/uracil phosphoribosyltransferase PyrR [Aeromicrobium sp.]MDF1705850.1 bifunctional pyr operon transcriptional regulator/uracil phosphoribosyltransferase PyrR [Aeromicrobium sp.]